jgi:hypothetical protein
MVSLARAIESEAMVDFGLLIGPYNDVQYDSVISMINKALLTLFRFHSLLHSFLISLRYLSRDEGHIRIVLIVSRKIRIPSLYDSFHRFFSTVLIQYFVLVRVQCLVYAC